MVETQKVLLSVFAHPDDESFGAGGTLAYYAKQGVQVYLACATRGEEGDVDPSFLEGYDSIADRRESELNCAAGCLGLAGVILLDYCDSGMIGSPQNQNPLALINAPIDEVAWKIAHQIRLLKPQVVMTNDPLGGYGHPDHIAVQRATLRAFSLAGDPAFEDDLPPYQPQRLYYHLFPRRMLRPLVRILKLFGKDPRHFGRNGDIDLQMLAEQEDFPVHAVIDIRSVREEKAAAGACHASQQGGIPRRGLAGLLARTMDRRDFYMRAIPEGLKGKKGKDLFEGVSVD